MQIALIGYGKMGKAIEEILLQRGHTVFAKGTSSAPLFAENLRGADVAIEFSVPEKAVDNIFRCFEANVPVVCGTTGWYNRIQEVRSVCEEQEGSLLFDSNFSLGVQLFQQTNRYLAKIMNGFESYQPKIHEIHHTEKLDAPSGTAISTAEIMLEELSAYSQWDSFDSDDYNENFREEKHLPITHSREEDVKGTHVISYTSKVDQIELKHQAFSRDGFALGAVLGSEWLLKKKGIYRMSDMLKEMTL
ncbi:MAG: 4-hydroxy-tetrahydrodipicolinate reductase [Flavobacteriales bacterium]|nr:4-hydroxy-tetrahydrodipicolinate reductase [Flavobacteriales bacterium]